MTSIGDTLAPERIRLQLRATTPEAALLETASLLQSATEIVEWEGLLPNLLRSKPCLGEPQSEFAICLPHVRSEAVSAMVLGIGRSESGIVFGDCPVPVRYIFCIAVPKTRNSDYLRIVGLLARMFKNADVEQDLRSAATADEFIEVLTRFETEL